MESLCSIFLLDFGSFLRFFEINCKKCKKIAEKFGSKDILRTFAIPNEKRSVRITVSTQDSQSCNRGSIPLPSTRKASQKRGFFHLHQY